jgi:hypothetical protein
MAGDAVLDPIDMAARQWTAASSSLANAELRPVILVVASALRTRRAG